MQVFVQAVDGGAPRAISSQTIEGTLASPDGRWIVAYPSEPGAPAALYPVDGGEPRPIRGLGVDLYPLQWSADGKELFVQESRDETMVNAPAVNIFRLDLETGEKRLWRTLVPDDLSGVVGLTSVRITPDGNAYFFRIQRMLSDLYVVEGLK